MDAMTAVLKIESRSRDEVPGSSVERERFSKLSDDPFGRWVVGRVEVDDATATVVDDEEPVKDAHARRWNGEEVHRGGQVAMIPQERNPSFEDIRRRTLPRHVAGDGALGNVEAQLEQLSVDTRRAPTVVGGHALDQHADLDIDARTTGPTTAR